MPINPRGYGSGSSPYLQKALDYNNLSTAPENWRAGGDGRLHQLQGADDSVENAPLVGVGKPIEQSFWGELGHALPYFGAAEGMGLLGMIGGPAAAATSSLGPSTAGSMAATQGALAAPAGLAAGGGSTMAGGASGILKGLIPDSKTLILSLLSLMGNGGPQRESFRDPGQMTDPKQALQQSLNGIYRLGQGVSEMGPVKLRSSYVQGPPSPVTIPGLPFQIGGGMGRDPALDNPALLEAGGGNPFKYDPFQSLSQAGSNGNAGAKRRTP